MPENSRWDWIQWFKG